MGLQNNYFLVLAIFSTLVCICYGDDCGYDRYGNYTCIEYTGLIYGISFGLTALAAIGIALCCICCECCPYYRGRNKNPQVFVPATNFVGVNTNGVNLGPGYTVAYVPYPNQANRPPMYSAPQYPNGSQQPNYPVENPPPYPVQNQHGGQKQVNIPQGGGAVEAAVVMGGAQPCPYPTATGFSTENRY